MWLDNVGLYLSQVTPEFAVFVKAGLGNKLKPYIEDFGNACISVIFAYSTLLMNREGRGYWLIFRLFQNSWNLGYPNSKYISSEVSISRDLFRPLHHFKEYKVPIM